MDVHVHGCLHVACQRNRGPSRRHLYLWEPSGNTPIHIAAHFRALIGRLSGTTHGTTHIETKRHRKGVLLGLLPQSSAWLRPSRHHHIEQHIQGAMVEPASVEKLFSQLLHRISIHQLDVVASLRFLQDRLEYSSSSVSVSLARAAFRPGWAVISKCRG